MAKGERWGKNLKIQGFGRFIMKNSLSEENFSLILAFWKIGMMNFST